MGCFYAGIVGLGGGIVGVDGGFSEGVDRNG
jgi:hypothetical protein